MAPPSSHVSASPLFLEGIRFTKPNSDRVPPPSGSVGLYPLIWYTQAMRIRNPSSIIAFRLTEHHRFSLTGCRNQLHLRLHKHKGNAIYQEQAELVQKKKAISKIHAGYMHTHRTTSAVATIQNSSTHAKRGSDGERASRYKKEEEKDSSSGLKPNAP